MAQKTLKIAVLAGMAALGAQASAASLLQLDVNVLTAQARDAAGANSAFGGTTHTGSIAFNANPNSVLNELFIDGSNQNIANGQLSTFTGVIELVNGQVSGGSLSMTLNNSDTFNADIVAGQGQVTDISGFGGFFIDGLITSAFFNANSFAGVDITTFFDQQPLSGSFVNFQFNPNVNGRSNNTDIDIFVVPAPASMALLGLGGLVATRRRR
ncbi:MAG: PEP-CTERM sorting domain-containing protein [Phycisphaerales bacterium]|nr:PEP-CTERM sorting domain-containing protein [Phycisphaerales bacterium]